LYFRGFGGKLPKSMKKLLLLSAMVPVLFAGIPMAFGTNPSAGWRTDGTGIYPSTNPVLKWSADENVIWKTVLPEWGNSMPVLSGDRIFLNVEPDLLVCVSVSDGKLLWSKATSITDTLTAEQKATWEKEKTLITSLEEEVRVTQTELQDLRRDQRRAPEAEKEAFGAKREALEKRRDSATEKLATLGAFQVPRTHDSNGYASATPVTDGRTVYVAYGTGVVAAYDFDGNRLWAKLVEQPEREFGHSSSPLLVDGNLIVHFRQPIALNPATGETVWKSQAREGWGTAAVTNIDGVNVLVTPNGDILRANDGKNLASGLFSMPYGSPIVQEGVIYLVDENGGAAFRLPKTIENEKITVEPLWKNAPPKDRYYSSPIVVDGVLYVMHRRQVFSAIDAATGEVLFSEPIDLGKGQQLYGSLSLAGDHLFVSHDSGYAAVLKPGRTFQLVGTNTLEPTRSTPIFSGDKIYFRTDRHLFCLGK